MKPKILTISELTRDIKEVLESVFSECWVTGEISNFSQPASGHMYFSLKDETASLRCVFFRGSNLRLKYLPADGMQVIAQGRVSIYEKGGQYQLYVNTLEPKGQGALQLAFEQLKEKLAREGLFDEARKKPLPFLPRKIGIVTSPTGAVIHDMLRILDRRFGAAHVVLAPVPVQGDQAPPAIIEAVAKLNAFSDVDVIIIARGGGSLEDLWAFNDEGVARAIAASRAPVISAVGHETDFTIADFVADRRAPTPSAAAEIVMPSRAELDETLDHLTRHLWRSLAEVVPQYGQRVADALGDIERATGDLLERHRETVDHLMARLEALNPLSILRRGYSITIRAKTGQPLLRAEDVVCGERITTRLAKGTVTSEVVSA